MSATPSPRLSVILPFFNEEGNVESVLREIRECQPDAEIVAVDDASTDRTGEKIAAFPGVVHVRFEHNLGQSAALYAGMRAASGEICVLMDGDGQIDPNDIARLLPLLESCDVVCGYRENRKDSLAKRLGSKVANAVRGFLLQDGIRDTGCSLKLFRRELVRFLVPFNGLHRFMPALFLQAGLKIKEAPVRHRARLTGVSKYSVSSSLARGLRGLRDIMGVRWLLARNIRWQTDPHERTTRS